ncbi:Hypothetical predicted protein [Cloeon dipterum]|uniref:Nuclear receptor-binding factor 2 MIT domain-containing protein n=1 Tax=Cloeon dipterum TaxID=197152 RepID=A0A8S1C5T6_9INSE|nr:Hypothetical predicted protein [Cloeon dipterum]
MENAPLNKAHYQARCAANHSDSKRYSKAAECHRAAAALMDEALKCTNEPKAIESLTLQKKYHLRMAEFTLENKIAHEKMLKDQEHWQQSYSQVRPVQNQQEGSKLHTDIFRTMEEADSLMANLLHKDESAAVAVKEVSEPSPIRGIKQPKGDSMVMEELKTLTQILHNQVKQLVNQLDEKDKEIGTLRNHVHILEEHLEACFNAGLTTTPAPANPVPSAIRTTPKTEETDFIDTRTLPVLAPLEMPNFDFSLIGSKSDITGGDDDEEKL